MEPNEDLLDIDPTQPLSIADALRLATALHRRGHLDEAREIYGRVLALDPDHPDALHFLGLLAHHERRDRDAMDLMARSVELAPRNPGFRSNLANLMLDAERFEDAEREYRQALAIAPDRPDVLNNYGVLCKALGHYEEAERCLLHALGLTPDFTDARNNLARLYVRMGRIDESVEQACEALRRAPHNAPSREVLGFAYCRGRQFDAAAAVYREWLEAEPDNPKARHHLAAVTGEDVPPRAPDAYVQSLFDVFAKTFDAKLALLEYRAPGLVAEAVMAHLGAAAVDLRVLDAGCGTGLCAPLLKPMASRLEGVDLSGGMLERAHARGLYDGLHQAELTDYLGQQTGRYSLVVSADTLVYFGDLAPVMRAAAGALQPQGHLCFTVEALGEDEAGDFRLRHHGRYAHSRAYLESVLVRAGLAPLSLERAVLRCEAGEPVTGWLVLARRPADHGPGQAGA